MGHHLVVSLSPDLDVEDLVPSKIFFPSPCHEGVSGSRPPVSPIPTPRTSGGERGWSRTGWSGRVLLPFPSRGSHPTTRRLSSLGSFGSRRWGGSGPEEGGCDPHWSSRPIGTGSRETDGVRILSHRPLGIRFLLLPQSMVLSFRPGGLGPRGSVTSFVLKDESLLSSWVLSLWVSTDLGPRPLGRGSW